MKKIGLIMLPLLLAACNSTGNPNVPAYSINLTSLGYEVDDEGKITIPEVRANLVSTAGAPDVLRLTYTAVLLNDEGKPAADATRNSPIVPANGTLLAGGKGGYYCFGGRPTSTTPVTPENGCTMGSPDAQLVTTGQWAANTVNRAIVPGEWAVAHLQATNGTAPWSADFTFTALQSTGRTVTWKQNYQFLAPAGAD